MTNRTVTVELISKIQGFVPGIATAGKTVRDFSGELDGLAKKNKSGFHDLLTASAGLGAGLAGAFALATKTAMDFDKQMSEVGAVSQASSADLNQLRLAAIQAGKDTAYSATEAADAEAELSKAGVSTADILGGALSGSLSLAAAGTVDLSDAATIAAQAMNVFSLKGSDVGHIADVLAAGANKSAADVKTLGDGLKQGGLVASQFGFTLEDTVGTLSAFADRALVGSDAGTSLKTMLTQLAAPSTKSAQLMNQLGINAYDTGGKFIGVAALAGNLRKALEGLSQGERNTALSQIFGSDAMRAAGVLYDLGEQGVRNYISAVDDQGAATKTANEKLNNLAGDLKKLHGTLQAVEIQASSGTSGGLRILTQAANSLLMSIANTNPVITSSVTLLGALAGGSLLAFSGFTKARSAVKDAVSALNEMGPVGQKAGTALSFTTTWAARAGLAFAGLEVVNSIASAFATAAPDVDLLAKSLQNLADTGEKSGTLLKVAGKDLSQFEHDVKFFKNLGGLAGAEKGASFEPGFMSAFDSSATKTLERMKAMDAALADLAKNGHAAEASKAFDLLAESAKKSGVNVNTLRGYLPQYAQAATDAAKATDATALAAQRTAAAQQEAAEKGNLLTEGWQAAVDQGKSLVDIFSELNDASAKSDESMLKALESVDNVKKSFDEYGKSLDRNTVAGLHNRTAIEAQTSAAADASDKKLKETGSVEAASKAYNDAIAPLKQVLKQYGFMPGQIDAILQEMGRMPDFKAVPISVPGAVESKVSVQTLNQQIQALKDRQVKISEQGAPDAEGQIARLQQQINNLTNRQIAITATAYLNTSILNHQIAEQQLHGFGIYQRWGGITQHAATGLLSEARTFSGGPTQYAFAEPATGGEAFVPRKGNYGRSMSILSKAAGWYGASVVPAGGAGGGGVEIRQPLVLKIDNETIWQGQLKFLTNSGKLTLGY